MGLDDRLHVQLFATSALPGNPMLYVRILKVDGTIAVQEERLPMPTLATLTTFAFFVPEGFILNACVSAGGGASARGTVYAQIDIIRGAGKDGTQRHKLSAGYLSQHNSVSWPEVIPDLPALGRGAITFFPIVAAAGTEFSVSLPAGSRARLMSIYAILVTSAAVATRQPTFALGGAPQLVIPAPSSQAASLTQTYSGGPAVGYQAAVVNRCTFPTPVDFWCPGGQVFVSSATGSLQAADQWSGNVSAELCVDN
jgi:hypothetical protein